MSSIFDDWDETKKTLLEGLSDDKKKALGPLLERQKEAVDPTNAEIVAREKEEFNSLNEMHEQFPDLFTESMAERYKELADKYGNVFGKIIIPMIRRIIPGMIAADICGVQPMTGPSGLVMSIRSKYSSSGMPEDDTTQNPK